MGLAIFEGLVSLLNKATSGDGLEYVSIELMGQKSSLIIESYSFFVF